MKKKIILLLVVVLLIFAIYLLLNKKAEAPGNTNTSTSGNASVELRAEDLAKYTIDIKESLYVIVNKSRPLPITYTPDNLMKPDIALIPDDNPEEQQLRSEAASAAKSMFEAAKAAGFDLVMASGYRSANLQEILYNGYVARDGQEAADRYSAKPGSSEHQTGLALDITTQERKCYLEICFADMPEGKWLKQNAHKYGFHLRYQDGKEAITGYQFEPWHFRYLGNDLAQKLYDSGQTMEEFFGLAP